MVQKQKNIHVFLSIFACHRLVYLHAITFDNKLVKHIGPTIELANLASVFP